MIRMNACCARVWAASHRSANVSDAMNERTSRSIRLLTPDASGPTSRCSRGRSVRTCANTSSRMASTLTCCLEGLDGGGPDRVLHLW